MIQSKTELKLKLIPLYQHLKEVCESNEKWSPFLMQWGEDFPTEPNKGIMFYGRATNGWFGTWDFNVFFSDNHKDRGWNRDDQMVWVENQWYESDDGYVTSNSQFWSVIRGISKEFYGEEWYKYVTWSNVCKVAPAAKGNPSDKLYYSTLENNQKIIKTEIAHFNPKFVVLFTGGDWSSGGDWSTDFISYLNNEEKLVCLMEFQWDSSDKERKCKVYKIEDIYYIVTLHPQGKTIQPHIDGIINLIRQIDKCI